MNKITKLILINLLLISAFLLIAEFICLIKYQKFLSFISYTNAVVLNDKNTPPLTLKQVFVQKYIETNYFLKGDFRPPAGLKYSKNVKEKSPIIILGCSYNYGYGLENEESFHYILAEYTKRPVYNLAVIGGGLKEALYLLRLKNTIPKLLNNNNKVKYVIYTYIPSHKSRLYENYRIHVPCFKPIKNSSKLKFYKFCLSNKTCLAYEIMKFYSKKYSNSPKTYKIVNLYFKEMNSKIKNIFNNYDEQTQMVVLVYNIKREDNVDWDYIRNYGIKVIKLNDLLEIDLNDDKYLLSDKSHPNAAAWEAIVPALVKELNL